jgi:hypothetical protein
VSTPSEPKPSLKFALREQKRAAREYIKTKHPLAELGMGDWFAESFLMEMEQREHPAGE